MEYFTVVSALSLCCSLTTATAFSVDDGGSDHRPISDEIHEYHPGGHYQSYGGYVSDWNKDWALLPGTFGGRGLSQAKCVDIPDNLTLCRGIGYGQMRLPNLLEHDSVKEATQQAGSWVPLLNIRCHTDTQMFLCSLFAPVCLDRPIYPCRTLCEAVKTGCENRMLKYGFPWPEMLRCDKFPLDNDLCIGVQSDNKPDDTHCQACVQPETFESIVDNFCNAEFVLRIKLERTTNSGSDLRISSAKKKKFYKKGILKPKELRDTNYYIEDGSKCRCNKLDNPAKNSNYLVMGHRRNDRMMLSFIQPFEPKSPAMSRALVAMRKKICKAGIQAISTPVIAEQNSNVETAKQAKKMEDSRTSKKTEKLEVKKRANTKRGVKQTGSEVIDSGGSEVMDSGKSSDERVAVKAVRKGRPRKMKESKPSL